MNFSLAAHADKDHAGIAAQASTVCEGANIIDNTYGRSVGTGYVISEPV